MTSIERPSRDALLAALEQIAGMRVPPIVAKVVRDALRAPDLEADKRIAQQLDEDRCIAALPSDAKLLVNVGLLRTVLGGLEAADMFDVPSPQEAQARAALREILLVATNQPKPIVLQGDL